MRMDHIISLLQLKHYGALVCYGLLFLLSGCTAQSLDLSLAPTPAMTIDTAQHQLPKSVGVAPFVDERPDRHGSDNAKWKAFIPGMLWIEISTDIPETYTPFSHYESKPLDRATTKACVNVLDRSLLFNRVIDLHKEPAAETDYVLSGVLLQTRVSETGYYYGSSTYAWLVRVLGLPYVSFNVEYHIGLTLIERKTGDAVWQTDLKGVREDKFYTVYSVSRGRDGKHVIAWNIADILAAAFNKEMAGLQQALGPAQ
jgi:hypothetical protein